MKKYITKKISEQKSINNLNKAYSALLFENGFTDPISISENLPDFKTKKNWLSKFLQNDMSYLSGTKEFADIVNANKDKHFCIIGDYDADGIMATTIMKLAFDSLGIKCSYLIPNRLEDGYGMKEIHVDQALEIKADIIITVDNGITEPGVVEYAHKKGLITIITDHHLPESDNIPKADLLIDPHLTNDSMKYICGAYVALKLVLGLIDVNDPSNDYFIRDLAMFAAVATITDVMPLVKENRLLVKYVLENMNFIRGKNIWAGRTMKFLSGFGNSYMMKDLDKLITEDTFGYYIGPTLNASGRINGEVTQIVQDIINAGEYKTYINGYYQINRERQDKTRSLLKEYEVEGLPISFSILDASKFDFPIHGLMGLVASRVSSEEQKPAFIGVKKDTGGISFSCRSPLGYSLHEGFNRIQETGLIEISGGGHDGAMGINLHKEEQLDLLRELLTRDYEENSQIAEEVVYEFEPEFIEEIFEAHRELQPFGQEFRGLNFKITGEYQGYDTDEKTLLIDGYSFKSFIPVTDLPEFGSNVEAIFKIGIDSKTINYFKIDELRTLEEEIV